MHYFSLYFLSTTVSQLIFHINGYIVSLCDDPVFYTADRLLNNTIRFYRGDHYWEMYGRPEKRGTLSGPHRIWWPGFHTVHSGVSVVTVLGTGDRVGRTLRIEGRRYNSWIDGRHVESGDLPIPHTGIRTIFHNNNPTNPMFIALDSNRVKYMTTKPWEWPRFVGYQDGYIGGQFGENFETDIDAAFSYPSADPNDEYYVYLFRKNKYCVRTAKKQCKEWRLNRQLFGCKNSKESTKEGITEFSTLTEDNFSIMSDITEDSITEPGKERSFQCCRVNSSYYLLCLVIAVKVFALL